MSMEGLALLSVVAVTVAVVALVAVAAMTVALMALAITAEQELKHVRRGRGSDA